MTSYTTSLTFVHFTLPQDTRAACAAARKFIKILQSRANHTLVVSRGKGSCLMQWDFEKASAALSAALPPDASLELTGVTEKQFEKGRRFWGQMRKPSVAAN